VLNVVPAWWLQAPLPIAFALSAWQFLVRGVLRALNRLPTTRVGAAVILVALALLVLTLLGAPLFAVIGASAMFGFHREGVDLSVVAMEFFGLSQTPVLVAIPLFTFAGFPIERGACAASPVAPHSISGRLAPGGLAIICLVVWRAAHGVHRRFRRDDHRARCGAHARAIRGRVRRAIQSRPDHGIGESRSVVRAVAAADPVRRRGAGAYRLDVRRRIAARNFDDRAAVGIQPVAQQARPPRSCGPIGPAVWGAVPRSALDLPLPFVVLGGIYSGYFAVRRRPPSRPWYVVLVEVVILREVRVRDLPRIMRESTVLVGAILVILGVSLASTNYMIDVGVPQQMFALVSQYVSGPNSFLLVLLVFLLIIGAILDIFRHRADRASAAARSVPVRGQSDSSRHHLSRSDGTRLPYATPRAEPFIASHRFEKDITEIYWATQPFLLVSLLAVIIIAFWPGLSLMLLH